MASGDIPAWAKAALERPKLPDGTDPLARRLYTDIVPASLARALISRRRDAAGMLAVSAVYSASEVDVAIREIQREKENEDEDSGGGVSGVSEAVAAVRVDLSDGGGFQSSTGSRDG